MIKKSMSAIKISILMLCMAFCSCQKENKDSLNEKGIENSKPISALTEKSEGGNSWAPDASKVVELADGILVAPPKGWDYIGYDQNQKIFRSINQTSKKISCTCNTTGTCKPFVAKGPGGSTQGCMGTCTNCTMTQSFGGDTGIDFGILSGGYYNKNIKPRLLSKGEEAPAVFKALVETKEFTAEISKFQSIAYAGKGIQKGITNKDGSISAPKGYSFVGVLIFGRGILMLLPNEYVKRNLGILGTTKASCSCTTGSCSLNDKTLIGVGAVWCEGSCTTCTLTTDDSDYSVRLYSYRY